MSSPLAGAWVLVSDTHEGVGVMTERYFNITWAEKDRKPFKQDENPSQAEAAEAYRSFSSAAGRYELSGNVATLHRMVNRNPSWHGQAVKWEYRLEGDHLTFGPNLWKRVE